MPELFVRRAARQVFFALFCALTCSAGACHAQKANVVDRQISAAVQDADVRTLDGLGACQGVSLHDGKVYLYGDVYDANPRVGVIREYTPQLRPTGRVIWLTKDGEPLLTHPTGLTWHAEWGCFLGDTVSGVANIYHIDWQRALADGNLDDAVLAAIHDDAAVNGCRPEFVSLLGQTLLATADYGDARPAVRLYSPKHLLKANKTSEEGVLVKQFACGPFNQNLHWDQQQSQLVCVQNVTAGIGWQLDAVDLAKAVEQGRVDDESRFRKLTFSPKTELEGYRPLGEGQHLWVTAHSKDNATLGRLQLSE